jgi:glycine/D-amino acid oxidase-like deaminating enzyme
VPGFGASTRNAGYVGQALLLPFSDLIRKIGLKHAIACYYEANAAFLTVTGLIEHEQIRCHYAKTGRIYWAYTEKQLATLRRELDLLREHLGKEGSIIGRDAESGELASRFYRGGLLLHGTGALHPALYHQGLLDRAVAAGASVIGQARVLHFAADPAGHVVTTERGEIRARDVIVATNGYIGEETPELQRGIVPVEAQMIATETLGEDRLRRLLPTGRTHLDVRAMFRYWRPSPDGMRLLFGGRTGLSSVDPEVAARALHAEMVEVFPDLAATRLSHFWSGRIGFTFDRLPHIGMRDGIHHAIGMNGAGVPMGTHLGIKIAKRVLGGADAATAFDDIRLPTPPFYKGRPWFLPLLTGWARWRHSRER